MEAKPSFLLTSWQQSASLVDFISGHGEAALRPHTQRGVISNTQAGQYNCGQLCTEFRLRTIVSISVVQTGMSPRDHCSTSWRLIDEAGIL
jgi:hypothetical protein